MTRVMTRRIRDPVHGLIVFGGGDKRHDETDRIAWDLIDTREFQRLRRIRQLGFSDLVFPGATHSRFAHGVGVYHTARLLADVIARRQGWQHDPDRERIALLAALLHDVGHGPFSHAFEAAAGAVGRPKRHEEWSVEIVQGETEVNGVLRNADETLPDEIGTLLMDEVPKDIYAAIVSSQFDADRLDYIQRDRMMTGVEFGHIDRDWLFDCLEVGSVTVGEDEPREVQCLCLGPKGVSVAEEYLQARFRLYRMVYMHKTTRAAEKMLEALLRTAAAEMKGAEMARQEPVLRYLTGDAPSLGAYLDLDDATVWSAISAFTGHEKPCISNLAQRLRDRKLYKCVDVGVYDEPGGNLHRRLKRALREKAPPWRNDLIYDEPEVKSYRWYDFDNVSALNKVLVKQRPDTVEPVDIVDVSPVVKTLQGAERLRRVYAPEPDQADQLREILKEVQTWTPRISSST